MIYLYMVLGIIILSGIGILIIVIELVCNIEKKSIEALQQLIKEAEDDREKHV